MRPGDLLIPKFAQTPTAETASASAPYGDPVVTFLTTVRVYAVPQYEGGESKSPASLSELFRLAEPFAPCKRICP